VLVVHDAVPQTAEPTVAETVESPGPKLKPVSVTHASSDIATFIDRPRVTAGASYVKLLNTVPTTLLTLTPPSSARPDPPIGAQTTLESLLHTVVKQPLLPSAADGLRLAVPKLSPDSVSETPALVAAFTGRTLVAKGASNVSATSCVPTEALTVTRATANPLPATGPLHCSDVPVVQAAVAHTPTLTTLAVAVKSAMPNDKPAIVKLPPPVCGMFGLHTRVTTGASKLSTVPDLVPTKPLTVTATANTAPV